MRATSLRIPRFSLPTDGIVLTRTAEVGQIAVPGSTVLFRLARDGQIEMRGQVAEQDVPRLNVGETARCAARRSGASVHRHGLADRRHHRFRPRARARCESRCRPRIRICVRGHLRAPRFMSAAAPGVILPQTAVLGDEQGTTC